MAKREVSNAFLWKALERYCVMGINFLLQLLLARLLSPNDFGVVAILGIFISFSNIFVQSGLSTALVQKKEIKDSEISAVFNFSLLIAIFIYLLIYASAPFLSNFFGMPALSSQLRILSLTIFPYFFNSLQTSLLRRQLKFKSLFICTCLAIVISGVSAVLMALKGLGVWALVLQQFIYSIAISLSLFYFVRWLPRPNFHFKEIRSMIDYGAKVLATSLVNEFFVELRTIIIGRMYNPAALAFFNRGRSFPDLGTKSIVNSLQAILLPVLAQHQENKDIQKNVVRKTILIGSFIVWPLLGIICICGRPFISLCLTDKWLPCVFYIYVFSVYFASWPIETVNLQLFYANGKSGTVLRLESFRKVFDLAILLATMWFGVKWIALGASVVSIISLPVYMYPAGKDIGYGIRHQLLDVIPCLTITAVSCCIAYVWQIFVINSIVLLILQPITLICVYILISRSIQSQALHYTLEYFRLYLKK